MVPSSNERRNGRGDRCLLKTLSHYVGELRQLTGGAEYQYDKKITQNTKFCASAIPYGRLHTVDELIIHRKSKKIHRKGVYYEILFVVVVLFHRFCVVHLDILWWFPCESTSST